ncbi:hypothetical protein BN1723_003454 [Verticillium longisporum]|nr:hypothetical protein BN1708_002511 [Verticillium longisporum]CRK27268.1 hypothetical protein BN1723_003454 [Verticillium longisporum]
MRFSIPRLGAWSLPVEHFHHTTPPDKGKYIYIHGGTSSSRLLHILILIIYLHLQLSTTDAKPTSLFGTTTAGILNTPFVVSIASWFSFSTLLHRPPIPNPYGKMAYVAQHQHVKASTLCQQKPPTSVPHPQYLPGIRCPTCRDSGKEVWVLPGKECGYCGTPCG